MKDFWTQSRRGLTALRDLLLISLAVSSLLWLGAATGVYAHIYRWLENRLSSNVGSILVAFALAAVGLAIFATRLWRSAAHEAAARVEAEGRFRTLVETIPAITYLQGAKPGKTVFYVSPQIESILGYTQEEWGPSYEVWLEAIHPDDRPRVIAADEESDRTGEPFAAEYRQKHKDGRWIWIRDEAVLVRDAAGEPQYWQGIRFDVTAQEHAEQHLREAKERFRTLVENLPAVTYIDDIDEQSSTIYVSPQLETLFGYTPREWTKDSELWINALHPDDRDAVLTAVARHNHIGEPFDIEYRLRAKDGHWTWVSDHATVVRGQDGRILFSQGVMFNITERRLAEEHMRETEAKYRALVEHIPAVLYIDPADGRSPRTYVSPQVADVLGITQEQYLENKDLWRELVHPDDREWMFDAYRRSIEEKEGWAVEYRIVRPDGQVAWIRDESAFLFGDEDTPVLVQGVMFDITVRKRAEEQVSFLAYHDKLTGLPNRALFEEMLETAIARAHRHDLGVGVLYLDLDNFKLVNDSLGHHAGDELLQQLAERLRGCTRETDLVARQGGDEFLLLLADLERGMGPVAGTEAGLLVAESVATRVHEALQEPFDLGGVEFFASASIGVSLFPQDATDSTSLLKNADSAMYQSKKAEPGGYIVYASGADDAIERLSLTTRLRRAVEQKHWVLHWQPVVELAGGTVSGLEALIRWREPNGGIVPPGEFIPIAEELGLIEAIGDWVIDEVARQRKAWEAEGIDVRVGFNLSPRQIWSGRLAEKMMEKLSGAGVDPHDVIVEITESTARADPDRTQRVLSELHAWGLTLAIDDFGTGYSSLARLKHLPVDILKIDRSFIHDVDRDEDSGRMVEAMIQLAHGLGMTPLAEGIETAEELAFLREAGCTLGQGFYFARPAPAEEIPALLAKESLLPDRLVTG